MSESFSCLSLLLQCRSLDEKGNFLSRISWKHLFHCFSFFLVFRKVVCFIWQRLCSLRCASFSTERRLALTTRACSLQERADCASKWNKKLETLQHEVSWIELYIGRRDATRSYFLGLFCLNKYIQYFMLAVSPVVSLFVTLWTTFFACRELSVHENFQATQNGLPCPQTEISLTQGSNPSHDSQVGRWVLYHYTIVHVRFKIYKLFFLNIYILLKYRLTILHEYSDYAILYFKFRL